MIKTVVAAIIASIETYSLAENAGIKKKKYSHGFLAFYTNLSNIVVWLYFIAVVINGFTDKLSFVDNPVISLSVTMSIVLTFLIYHFLLSGPITQGYKEGKFKSWNPFGFGNMSLHYYCPVATIAYWLVFIDKTGLKITDGLKWIAFPIGYLVYIAIRRLLKIKVTPNGGYYPYEFMNVDLLGIKQVSINIAVLIVIFAIIGMALSAIGILLWR